MKFILYTFILFLVPFFSSAHLELFRMSDANYFSNDTWTGSYGFDVTITRSKKLFIKEIGIDFFSVGDDNKAELELIIFDKESSSEIYKQSKFFSAIDNQAAFFGVDLFFEEGKNYSFVIRNTQRSENKDNLITLFKINELNNASNALFFTSDNIYHSNSNKLLFATSDKSDYFPFIHVGASKQSGISLIENQEDFVFQKRIPGKVCLSLKAIDNSIFIDSVGLRNVFAYSQSKLFMAIKNDSSNSSLFIIDTIFKEDFSDDLFFKLKFKLSNNYSHTFCYGFSSNKADSMPSYFKPLSIPFTDNLKKVVASNLFSINQNSQINYSDSISFPLLLNFTEFGTLNFNKKDIHLTYNSFGEELIFNSSVELDDFLLVDLLGNSYPLLKFYQEGNNFLYYFRPNIKGILVVRSKYFNKKILLH
jgi:hypothetical protein